MDAITQWLPLLAALGAVLLAWLLVVGRPSLRRAAFRLSLAAAVALLAELVVAIAMVGSAQHAEGPQQAASILQVADSLTNALTFAAWALLLYAVSEAATRVRLVAYTLVFTLALALQIAVASPTIPLLAALRVWLSHNDLLSRVIGITLLHAAAVAALVCMLLLRPARR